MAVLGLGVFTSFPVGVNIILLLYLTSQNNEIMRYCDKWECCLYTVVTT